jgi:hypothetical protein
MDDHNVMPAEDIAVICQRQSLRKSFKERVKAHKSEEPVRTYGQVAHAIFEAVRTVSYNPCTKAALQESVEKITTAVPRKEYNNNVGKLIVYQMALNNLCDDPHFGQDVCQLLKSTPAGGNTRRKSMFNEPFQAPSVTQTLGNMVDKLIGLPTEKDQAQANLYYARKARKLKMS